MVHRSLVFALASDNKGKSQKMLEEVLAFQTTSEMVTKHKKIVIYINVQQQSIV